MVSSIPADLHPDILVRLPAKSIGRFRCVSKRWLSITTDPKFIIAHSSSASAPSAFYLSVSRNKRPQLFLLNGDNTAPSFNSTFSFLLDIRGYPPPIFDSCNGLILCGIPGTTLLSVCNPTTRDLFVVPVPKQLEYFAFYLAFDLAVSPHIKIFGFGNYGGYCMYRFSSVTMAWECLDGHESFGRINTIHFPRSTFWKGNLCWITGEGLRCLDVEREETSQHPLPAGAGAMQCACLGESGGRLHCIVKNNGASRYRNSGYDVYEMESKSTGWSLLCYVDLGGIVDVHRELKKTDEDGDLPIKVLWFLRGGADEVGDRLLLGIPRKIVIYNLKDESFTTICSGLRPYRGTHSYSWTDIHPHANTLFRLNAASSHKNWICWKSKYDELLIRLMVENSLSGQKTIPGFKKKAWLDMVEKFNEATQLNYEVHHLRDRFKSYRSDFQSVARLLRCEGFRWNPERKVVTASDTNWKRQHPFAEYKRKQVPFRDLEIIFASPTTSDEVDTEIHEREDLNIDNEKELADTQHGLPLKRKMQHVNS